MFKSVIASLFLLVTCFSAIAEAAVIRAPKQMFILRPTNNQIWGNYIFSAESTEEKGEKASFELLLPKETVDFRAVQGLTSENIQLKDEAVYFSKFVPSRLELYGVDFLLEAAFGQSKFTLNIPYHVPEISILIPEGSSATVVDSSKKIEETSSMHIGETTFKLYRFKNNSSGEQLSFVLKGISQGRGALWIVGWVFLGLLITAAASLSLLNSKA